MPERHRPSLPLPLPLLEHPPERGDAAANRKRILAAARALFAERGVDGTSMDAVAAAARVGKGTLFRRFGDRAGLIDALLDDAMAEFQDAFLSGPPPLGPTTPASVRLEAFLDELVRLIDAQLDFALAATRATAAGAQVSAHGPLALFVRVMLAEIDPSLDDEVVAELLLGATSAGVVYQLRRDRGIELERIQAAARALLHGVIESGDDGPRGAAHPPIAARASDGRRSAPVRRPPAATKP
ncbi:MAG TPA: helix-turn-helix domain-containing protein [Solirubrobacteraceae bacterium]|jgi:AcrR family transcriptional regulator|nr:helix-turn-helix domain-containing protein [Solirubrobacteraceae bacterium]